MVNISRTEKNAASGLSISREDEMRTGMVNRAAAAVFLLAAGMTTSHAQFAWKPEGNVEFVVGAGADGENDRIARAIQHALLKEHLVDSMTVLNRPGAAQTIAINYLAQKKGDGYAQSAANPRSAIVATCFMMDHVKQ
jgi:tripartite-type tricarboxylate transporter receptor subunit TctC